MRTSIVRDLRSLLVVFTTSLCLVVFLVNIGLTQPTQNSANQGITFNDAHFHLTNYIQKGIRIEDFLKLMGDKVDRVAVFGIPLHQKWDYFVDGNRSPDYYLLSDTELYYYSLVDAMIAQEYLRLTPDKQKHFDPMITGFNPTDMYATAHILRVLRLFPGVFTGIGEFTIHKEFVSDKVGGHTASLTNPSLDRVFSMAGEIGLVTLIHCDIDTVRPTPGDRPAYFDKLKQLFKRHPETSIIWAHTGLGRIVAPRSNHLDLLEEILDDPEMNNVVFDISWDEVAKWVVKSPETAQSWARLINGYPNRFLFGTDAVAPKDSVSYLKTYQDYKPLWNLLDKDALFKVTVGNYRRVFDEAAAKVRVWEKAKLQESEARLDLPNADLIPKTVLLPQYQSS
ncbi:MAG: amidohydrolase family protein [Gloeomargaritaceae cyanobacterium C42_A2020_066]|nr:amidohydrolase family protein [Gloeomargaritaceae cyanobacterium C42_A2020_066]